MAGGGWRRGHNEPNRRGIFTSFRQSACGTENQASRGENRQNNLKKNIPRNNIMIRIIIIGIHNFDFHILIMSPTSPSIPITFRVRANPKQTPPHRRFRDLSRATTNTVFGALLELLQPCNNR